MARKKEKKKSSGDLVNRGLTLMIDCAFRTTWTGSPDLTAHAAERDCDYGLAILSLILIWQLRWSGDWTRARGGS
jgi:hypothetical protein